MSDEIKELKAITLQILKNQTLMIAHLVNQARQNKPQQHVQPPLMLKQVKTEPCEPPSTVSKRKAPSTMEQPLKEISFINKNNGGCATVNKRRRVSAPNAAGMATKQNTKFCKICDAVVDENSLMSHIWEHILKKMMKEKADLSNAYSFVCDVNGCVFRTNKLEAAGGHAIKHPEVERNKVVLDNRENSEPLFLATLAQCYDRMSDSEKDEVFRKRYD
ncbi:hypothetical protein niasHS_013573 [Heterodera schachtii]|uniref:C2H2-type domain-containing protein n=1 Tax=Heterodera schachtii TaxID=97005 RepID=A0ABD2IB14_HETSC